MKTADPCDILITVMPELSNRK